MWLPDWLYNALPLIYAGGGILSIYHANHPVAYGSGMLLILTAFLVFKLRKDYREKEKRR
jgi:hypothetical protein